MSASPPSSIAVRVTTARYDSFSVPRTSSDGSTSMSLLWRGGGSPLERVCSSKLIRGSRKFFGRHTMCLVARRFNFIDNRLCPSVKFPLFTQLLRKRLPSVRQARCLRKLDNDDSKNVEGPRRVLGRTVAFVTVTLECFENYFLQLHRYFRIRSTWRSDSCSGSYLIASKSALD